MSEYEYTRLSNEFTCSMDTSQQSVVTKDTANEYDFQASSLRFLSSDIIDSSQKLRLKEDATFSFVNLENNCSTLLNEQETNKINMKTEFVQNDYDQLKNELNHLRSNLTKFCADLLLNELKLEMKYLVEKIKVDLEQNMKANLNQLIYEQAILNAKLATLECKILNSQTLLSQTDDQTTTFLHFETDNADEELNESEVM